jgi:hypothetical protein
MSQLLPYFGLGLLFLAVLGLWVRQSFVTRAGSAELLMPRQHRSGAGSAAPHRDLGERIFGPQDWGFVSRETLPEIQRMFRRERTVLAIAWLRRTRLQVSQVMRAHVAGAQQSDDLQIAAEIRIALSYFFFLILCNSLIGWIWLHGPVRARKVVGRTLQWAAQLRGAFERLMASVDPASCRVVGTHFNHGTVRS